MKKLINACIEQAGDKQSLLALINKNLETKYNVNHLNAMINGTKTSANVKNFMQQYYFYWRVKCEPFLSDEILGEAYNVLFDKPDSNKKWKNK